MGLISFKIEAHSFELTLRINRAIHLKIQERKY